MNSQQADPLCRIFLFGPLTVQDRAGTVRTPRGQKVQALVAMLALAPRGARSRVWLRDKLWSDRQEEQASASLRQALTELRKALGPLAQDILNAERTRFPSISTACGPTSGRQSTARPAILM